MASRGGWAVGLGGGLVGGLLERIGAGSADRPNAPIEVWVGFRTALRETVPATFLTDKLPPPQHTHTLSHIWPPPSPMHQCDARSIATGVCLASCTYRGIHMQVAGLVAQVQ